LAKAAPLDAEIIVDNGSTDKTPEIIEAWNTGGN
jgi:glycosyltransferase involved in cell wall biosynthesis